MDPVGGVNNREDTWERHQGRGTSWLKNKERETSRSGEVPFMSRLTGGMKTRPNTQCAKWLVADKQVLTFESRRGERHAATTEAEKRESRVRSIRNQCYRHVPMSHSCIWILLDYGLSRRIEATPLIGRWHKSTSRFVALSWKRVEASNVSMDAHRSTWDYRLHPWKRMHGLEILEAHKNN